jgi:hypothetical protein
LTRTRTRRNGTTRIASARAASESKGLLSRLSLGFTNSCHTFHL